MKISSIYLTGIIIVFLGLVWLFFPQTYETFMMEGTEESDSHLETIPYGFIVTLIGFALIAISNKYERKKIRFLSVIYLIDIVSILSIGSGLLHAALITDHFREWWGYGLFFVVVAIIQVGYGMIFLFQIRNYPRGIKSKKTLDFLYILGIAGNLFIIALYVITRTVGIPFFGPGAGEVESVAPIDIFSKGLEIWLVIILVLLLRLTHLSSLNNKR